MSELSIAWDKYKLIQQAGKRTSTALKLEVDIHAIQKSIGKAPYDFDASWARVAKQASSTVTGPPMDAIIVPTQPQANFTLEQAISKIGKNDCALFDDIAMLTECRMIYLAHVHDKINPIDNKNVARRGQACNFDMAEYRARKENA